MGDETHRSGGAHDTARAVLEAYDRYARGFLSITRRARARFERREWHAQQADTLERLGLYQRVLDEALAALQGRLAAVEPPRSLWRRAKRHFCAMVGERDDAELAETFFGSVARRALSTVGVDPETEFTEPGRLASGLPPAVPIFRRYPLAGTLTDVARALLADSALPLGDLDGDAARVAVELERLLAERDESAVERVDVLEEPFFRGQVAYLVGRIWTGEQFLPLVIALLNPSSGICADAVLLDAREVGPIFSLSRAYFFHAQPNVGATVRFLEPVSRKPRSELYTALGHKRHGKTELYRNLRAHLSEDAASFVVAPGAKGLVMIVFTMPGLDVVFKVIRDRPKAPKDTTREEVMRRYRLVFERDRVGRLLDAQEFEHLRLSRSRFSPELLEALLSEAPQTVSLDGDTVVLGHVYVERRVVPLDLFVREKDEAAVRAAVLDYGAAIEELACADIFPGDILLKNFGVKSDGRVVFYDYDELALVTELEFRAMPQTDDLFDEIAADPWFYVGEKDIFPEEFLTFIALPERHRALLEEEHGGIFRVEFWKGLQERHRRGELIRVLPYARRLP